MLLDPFAVVSRAFDEPRAAAERDAIRAIGDFGVAITSLWAFGREAVANVEEVRGGLFDGVQALNEGLARLVQSQIDESLKAAREVLGAPSPAHALQAQADYAQASARAGVVHTKALSDISYELSRRLIEPFHSFSIDGHGWSVRPPEDRRAQDENYSVV